MGIIKVDNKLYRFLEGRTVFYETILSSSEEQVYESRYTETAPEGEWMGTTFNDDGWKTGKAPFGNSSSGANTRWTSKDLWVRRVFEVDKISSNKLNHIYLLGH